MKTSSVILISTLSLIALFILSLLIISPEKKTQKLTETMSLPVISHIIIGEGSWVYLSVGDTNKIQLTFNTVSNQAPSDYKVFGDTLIIETLPGNPDSYVEVWSNQLKSVYVNSSRLFINNVNMKELKLEAKEARVRISKADSLQSIYLSLEKKTDFTCMISEINSITIEMNRSKANLNVLRIDEIKADLKNKSEMTTLSQNIHKTSIVSDETSRFRFR